MNFKTLHASQKKDIASLFTSSFTDSEGSKEGNLIGNLSYQLACNIDNKEIICYGAKEEKSLVAIIFFTRISFSFPSKIFMLAPVAVKTNMQGKGIGQKLINYGINELKERGINIVVTYGDPAFYSKVGFNSLSEKVIQAPLKLSMPFGWQGQSLTDGSIPVIDERPACVKQFNDPAYW